MTWQRFNQLLRDGCVNPDIACKYYGPSAPAPDYTPLANASAESAQVMQNLGQQQIDLAKQQYAQNEPIAQEIAQQQLDIGNQNQAAAANLQAGQAQALSEAESANTANRQEQAANQAGADQAQAEQNSQQSLARNMASMGVNPNSGKFAAMSNANNVTNAAATGSAMNNARNSAVQTGLGNLLSAAGMGGGAAGAYSVALNAGNSAQSNTMAPGQALLQGMASGAGTIGSGQQMQIGGLSNILNSQTDLYGQSMNNTSSMIGAGIGGIAGLGGAALGAFGGSKSDRRLKENIELIKILPNGLGWYEFNYIIEPECRYRGVMADEVLKFMPDAVGTDSKGFMWVDYGALGLAMESV